jgi:hypothetical protein
MLLSSLKFTAVLAKKNKRELYLNRTIIAAVSAPGTAIKINPLIFNMIVIPRNDSTV